MAKPLTRSKILRNEDAPTLFSQTFAPDLEQTAVRIRFHEKVREGTANDDEVEAKARQLLNEPSKIHPIFPEWMSNKTFLDWFLMPPRVDLRLKMAALLEIALEKAKIILTDADPKSYGASTQLVTIIIEATGGASKTPAQDVDEYAKMSADDLVKYLRSNGVDPAKVVES